MRHAARWYEGVLIGRVAHVCVAGILAIAAPSCAADATAPTPDAGQRGNVVALVEITFTGIGTQHMTSAARVVAIPRGAPWLRADDAQFDLSIPVTSDGSTDTTIQLDSVLATSITHGGWLYLHSVYRVRNASNRTRSAFDTPRSNLTFMAVETAQTIPGTPVLNFIRGDGSPGDPLLAQQVVPTGAAFLDAGGNLVSLHPDVLQVITEDEVADIHAPGAVVTSIFPYGFVVRRAGSSTTRALDASPAADTFDGIVNFALRIPLQPDPSQNPSSLTIMVLALDDSDTRVTQSLEEQSSAGRRASLERAASLRAGATLLAGGTLPWYGGYRTLCTVRTAGRAESPIAYLVNVVSSFASLAPDPYAADGAGSFIDRASQLAATFTHAVTGAGPATFRVRGVQSGPAHRNTTYTGDGTTTVVTPQSSFVAGEEVEFVTTTALSCPQPHAGRLRVAALAGTGRFNSARVIELAEEPSVVVMADVNGDRILDAVVANSRSNSLSVLVGNGDGTFQTARTYPAGAQPDGMAVGDLNDDGALDVVVANPGTVSLLLGNGDGTLRAHSLSPRSGNIQDIALADMNADGALDLLIAHQQGHLSIALGNGDGTFIDRATVPAASRATALAVADFDGDGNLDVAMTDESKDVIAVILGNGDGTFQLPSESPACEVPIRIASADFNRDGIPDVVVVNDSKDELCVLIGRGDGEFAVPRQVASGVGIPLSLAVGDIDANGALDLVLAGERGELVALIANGDGTFMPARLIPAPEAGTAVLADVDGNGSLDLIAINLEATQLPGGGASGSLSMLTAR